MSAALVRASGRGDLRAVERLIAAGVDVNAQELFNWRGERCMPPRNAVCHALHAACEGGHLTIVKRLLAAGANIHEPYEAEAYCELVKACEGGHLNVVECLLEAGINAAHMHGEVPCWAIAMASANGHLAIVERLLGAGAIFSRHALLNAVGDGHLAIVECLLAAGAAHEDAVDLRFLVSEALVHAAGKYGCVGRLPVVELLLAHGADVYAFDDAALCAASEQGNRQILQRLMDAGAAAGPPPSPDSALRWACARGDVAAVDQLLAGGPAVGYVEGFGYSLLRLACQRGHADVVDRLLANDIHRQIGSGSKEALADAARFGRMPIVDRLLVAGIAHNIALFETIRAGRVGMVEWFVATRGLNSPYAVLCAVEQSCAVGHASTAVLELLLAAGADPNATHFDRTPLASACFRGHLAIIKCLMDAGAHASAECLTFACAKGHAAVAEYLLRAGVVAVDARLPVDERISEEDHWTGLVAACKYGHRAVVDCLLAAGADVHLENDLALCFASETGDPDLVEQLLRHSADPARISWDDLPEAAWPRLVTAVARTAYATLPADVQPVWLRFHLRLHARLRPLLQRARDRLDCPPQGEPLGPGTPTQERLIVHLQTAGRRFAREYWTDGLPIFFPGVDFGPVPDCFLFDLANS